MTSPPRVLIANRGSFSGEQLEQLAKLGIAVAHTFNVEGIKSVSDVPLRDYFAAAALTGWLYRAQDSETMPADLARWAYRHADAMLAERDK